MKAPEKIYRTTTYLNSDRGNTVWKNKPVPGADNIEYTRTDALIEKACEWLKNNSHNYANNALGKEYLVNDFVNYMKGE